MKPSRTDAITAKQATAALSAMLIMATDLSRLSLDSLARSYRVPRATIARMLEAEKARRAGI